MTREQTIEYARNELKRNKENAEKVKALPDNEYRNTVLGLIKEIEKIYKVLLIACELED